MRPVPTNSSTPLTDRAPERQPIVGELHKPAVLSRAHLTGLCVASLSLILYGTLGPVAAPAQRWFDRTAKWSWQLPVRDTDVNDVITNIVVYVPVGIALRLLVRRRGRAGWPDFAIGLGASLALSYATEFLQQFMPLRSTNQLDIATNAVGALIGCLLAVRVQRGLRRVHAAAFESMHLRRDAWSVLLWSSVVVALIILTMPWTLKRPELTWGFDQPVSVADPLAVGRFVVFAVVGLLGAGRALLLGLGPRVAIRGTIWRLALFAESVELAQSVLGEHVSCQLHALIATLGAAVGAIVAVQVVHPPSTVDDQSAARRRLRGLALVALALVIALSLARDVGLGSPALAFRPSAEFRWIPFRSHFNVAFTAAVVDLAQSFVKYAVLGLIVLAHSRGRQPAAALLLVLAVAGTIEIARAFLTGRPGDSTTLVVALAAWAVVARAWAALYPARVAAPSA